MNVRKGESIMEDMLEFIKSRRSTRKYKEETVSDEQLDMVIEAGRFAPQRGKLSIYTFYCGKE